MTLKVETMEDYIVNRIQDIFDLALSVGGDRLNLEPKTFNPAIYNGIISIMNNAVMPVAYTILGLLFVLEMYNITIRTEGQYGTMGIEVPFKVMFKIVICKTALDSTKLILEAIYEISTKVINNIGSTLSGSSTLTPADIDSIRAIVDRMNFGVKLLTAVEITIIYLIVQFINLIVMAIVVGRMIEIYVMMAIAPIPIATLPNAELSGVGKNFLKYFAAICIQGVLIFIVASIFPMLFGSIGSIDDPANFSKSLLTATGYSIVLLIAIFSTGKWAKSICNAM